jgi:signal transduction histidine kinase
MPAPTEETASGPGLIDRLGVGQLIGLIVLGPLVVLLVSVLIGFNTVSHQSDVRTELLSRVEPAASAALRLQTALVNQETGIRGYELTGQRVFLRPYLLGLSQEVSDAKQLAEARVPGLKQPLFIALTRIHTWQASTAEPAVLGTRVARGSTQTVDAAVSGKAQFDAIRVALDNLEGVIVRRVQAARRDLDASAGSTQLTLATIAIVLLLIVLGTGLALRVLVSRPLSRLTTAARQVAGGDLEHPLSLFGPRDIVRMAADVDAMRQRLLAELESITAARNELAVTAAELERSNQELEQFAYLASHDLQEPLRKVTSFCQLLQDRYGGQLDERADQYIAFAVDGATRMQQLINDLLAFSRVGRSRVRRLPVDLTSLAHRAAEDLAEPARDSGAEITIDPLPTLPVEASLLRTVFQNLLGNALKFCGEAPPRIHIAAEAESDVWQFSCTDNGIGIDPQYAERIFIIFQRLHTRTRYAGTGIGLAMSRKIVEDHGGRMWLDTHYGDGTRILFTLPRAPGTDPLPSASMAA